MTASDLRARMAHAAERAPMPDGTPTGRSYHVRAQDRRLAGHLSRLQEFGEGWRDAAKAPLLHVERIGLGLYEVVLGEPR